MKYFSTTATAVALGCATVFAAAASAAPAAWHDVAEASIPARGERAIQPDRYRTLRADRAALAAALADAPLGASGGKPVTVALPLPDGRNVAFRVVETPIMAPALQKRYPDIRTYTGTAADGSALNAWFDLTPAGFHAMIRGPGETFYIDPYEHGALDRDDYVAYRRTDYRHRHGPMSCGFDALDHARLAPSLPAGAEPVRAPSGDTLRTYRIAVAATGEYTTFHGGSVAAGLAAIVTAINRVTGLYEMEMSIRFELVPDNDQVVYTNAATDPYSNFDGFAMLSQNDANLDSVIGTANYDIGHVFSTGGGGIAALGVVCTGFKGQGVTGLPVPVGDPFYVDFVSHEIGHQLDATHTFNGTASSCGGANRSPGTAYEPGSGSTIMAYAGICGSHNIQDFSDPYFHVGSFDQVVEFKNDGFGSFCGTVTSTGNSAPVVDAGQGGLTIPANTPFELVGSAVDPEGHDLVYAWEQFDLGPGGAPQSPSGNAPLFRSFLPVDTPVRSFPKIESVLSGGVTVGEVIPSYDRSMTFRLTARDNQPGGGGVDYATVSLDVTTTAGPFEVTSPGAGVTWAAGSVQFVTWDVANTDAAPVSCANVDVELSLDGGFTYPVSVADDVPNNGFAVVTIPNAPTTEGRLRVKCADNVFYNVNAGIFEVTGSAVDFTVDVTPESVDVCASQDALYSVDIGMVGGSTDPVTLSVTESPAGTTASFDTNPVTPGSGTSLTIGNTAAPGAGSFVITVEGTAAGVIRDDTVMLNIAAGPMDPFDLSLPADGATGVSTAPTLDWNASADADSYRVDIATDPDFVDVIFNASGLTTTSLDITSGLPNDTELFWRVSAVDTCGELLSTSAFSFTTESEAIDTDQDGVDDSIDNCTLVPNPDQVDTNGDLIGNACDADLNGDCGVNFGDLALLKAAFFPVNDLDADFNGDESVNFGDLALMKSTFFNGANPGPGPGAPGNACEPQ